MEITRAIIEENLGSPEKLERLYRADNKAFTDVITGMGEEGYVSGALAFWKARLFLPNGKAESAKSENAARYFLLAGLVLAVWVPCKLWAMSDFALTGPYYRIIPAVFALALGVYFMIGPLSPKRLLGILAIDAFLLAYSLALPQNPAAQTPLNAFLYSFILLWFGVWLSYSGFDFKDMKKLGEFAQITGETIIWSTLLCIGGAILAGLSIALFSAIGIDVAKFYSENAMTLGICAAPFVALSVIRSIGRIRLSAILANIFMPLFVVSILAFGLISFFSNVRPYDDRNVFILYNVTLALVICLLTFANLSGGGNILVRLAHKALPAITVILDAVTLSAIIYRIGVYGATANKITLLATNIAMLGNLVYVIYLNVRAGTNPVAPEKIMRYLPVYAVLSVIIVFVFPFLFGMK